MKKADAFLKKHGYREPTADERLRYYPGEKLELIQGAVTKNRSGREYGRLAEYAHLKDQRIHLDAFPLTDKQLTALSLVFYGGIKKNRAAKVMKITTQALDDHLKAGLKKIAHEFR